MPRYDRIVDSQCYTGEGPLWHTSEQYLYWVDIPNGRLFKYNPDTEENNLCYETDTIGGFTIQQDDSLLLFEESGRIERWDDGDTTTVTELTAERNSRFNDVIADPHGRVFCGTMPTDERSGRLYRIDTDLSITRVVDAVGLPNGLGFSPDRQQCYYTDTTADRIYRFDYDGESGELTNRTTFCEFDGESGQPDGMTVDSDGHVWSALWDGGCLVRLDPTGTKVARIEFPAKKISAVTFGGQNCEEAYVTTALNDNSRAVEGDGAGALFRLTPDVGGVPEFRSRIQI